MKKYIHIMIALCIVFSCSSKDNLIEFNEQELGIIPYEPDTPISFIVLPDNDTINYTVTKRNLYHDQTMHYGHIFPNSIHVLEIEIMNKSELFSKISLIKSNEEGISLHIKVEIDKYDLQKSFYSLNPIIPEVSFDSSIIVNNKTLNVMSLRSSQDSLYFSQEVGISKFTDKLNNRTYQLITP